MKPPLAPSHGTSLATTAGITAVITLVAAVGSLAQSNALDRAGRALAVAGAACFVLAATALYNARNRIGAALDWAASDAFRAGIAAAQGQLSFHLGMAAALAGAGCVSAFRLAGPLGGYAWAVPTLAAFGVAVCAREAWAWQRELRVRRGNQAPEGEAVAVACESRVRPA